MIIQSLYMILGSILVHNGFASLRYPPCFAIPHASHGVVGLRREGNLYSDSEANSINLIHPFTWGPASLNAIAEPNDNFEINLPKFPYTKLNFRIDKILEPQITDYISITKEESS